MSRRSASHRVNPPLAMALLLIAVLLLALGGCADRPDLSGRVAPLDRDLPWPSLIDMSDTTATALTTTALATDEEDAAQSPADQLAARARALQSRARRLSARPVLTGSERNRLLSAIARHF